MSEMKPKNQKIVVMLQARLGSSRLPQKVLLDLDGVPMIEHIMRQVAAVKGYELEFVLSTSPDALDDRLVDWAKERGLRVFRHNVDDIVGRLHGSLELAGGDVLLRVWGDCVFICPDVIERMLALFFSRGLDFVTNAGEGRNLPVGLDCEIYSLNYLRRLNSQPDVFFREFPLQFALRHPDVQWANYLNEQGMPVLHLTVDYPEDFQASKKIIPILKNGRPSFSSKDLALLLEQRQDLFMEFAKAERQGDFKAKLNEWSSTRSKESVSLSVSLSGSLKGEAK